ncbi:unnamed protein product [Trichobilharzia szidati]|nr:unnamed protein product [Trichobilharzia szidati]
MNFMKWITGSSEDSTNNDQLDYSFLFPVTIGVGSILICLAAHYRNELPSLRLKMYQNAKDDKQAPIRRGNPYTKENKKKTKHSNKPESRISEVQVQKTPEVKRQTPVVNETKPPVVSTEQAQHTTVQPPQIQQENVSNTIDRIEAEFFNPAPKKPKKSKRSSKTKDNDGHGLREQAEVDPAWVTVTSKKVKLSSRSSQNKTKSVESEASGDQSVSESQSPSDSVNESPIQHKQGDFKQQESPVNSKDKPTKLESSVKTTNSPKQEKVTTPSERGEHVKVAVASPNPTTSYEELLLKNLGAETVTAIRSLILNSESHIPRSPEAHSSPAPANNTELNKQKTSPVQSKESNQTPKKNDLISQHTAAQLQAREAECQILRTEVVHLREEVTMLKSLAINHVPIKKPMNDAETMTDVMDQTKMSSNDPDAVLLSTLQAEIARLAKEVVIYQQRSENLKTRLDAANKKLSDSKSKSVDEAKLLQQSLDSQTEKLHEVETENKRLEKELNDALQKAEVHRRKLEESEHNINQRSDELETLRVDVSSLRKNYEALENGNSLLREEKDTLARKYDELNKKHATIVTELNALQSQCSVFHRQVADYEERLHKVNEQHQHTVDDLKEQLKSLLCNSQTNEKSHINMIHTLEAKVEQLTKEADEHKKQISAYEVEVKHLQAQKNTQVAEQINTVSNEDKDMQTSDDVYNRKSNVNQSNNTESSQYIVESMEYRLLQAQVEQYKSALDATELMLSKLQTSVNEEEARWHKALDAANIENELLKTKSTKLEAALNELVQDRNALTKTIEELRNKTQFNNCNSIDTPNNNNKTDKSSSISPSPSSPLSTTTTTTDTDEQNMSKSELITLVTKLRYLVEVERNALKQEQSLSAELRTKLNGTNFYDDNISNNHNNKNNNHLPNSFVDDDDDDDAEKKLNSKDQPSSGVSHTKDNDNCVNHKDISNHYNNTHNNNSNNNGQKDTSDDDEDDDGVDHDDDDDNVNNGDMDKCEKGNTSYDVISKVADCIPPHEISSNDSSYILLSNGINGKAVNNGTENDYSNGTDSNNNNTDGDNN